MGNYAQLSKAIEHAVFDTLILELEDNGLKKTADFLRLNGDQSFGELAQPTVNAILTMGRSFSFPLGHAQSREEFNANLDLLTQNVAWLKKLARLRELNERITANVMSREDGHRHIISVLAAVTSNFARMLDVLELGIGSEVHHDLLTQKIYGLLHTAAQQSTAVPPEVQ